MCALPARLGKWRIMFTAHPAHDVKTVNGYRLRYRNGGGARSPTSLVLSQAQRPLWGGVVSPPIPAYQLLLKMSAGVRRFCALAWPYVAGSSSRRRYDVTMAVGEVRCGTLRGGALAWRKSGWRLVAKKAVTCAGHARYSRWAQRRVFSVRGSGALSPMAWSGMNNSVSADDGASF